jgi:eukaryotic-like serine/threonine-protein kinase
MSILEPGTTIRDTYEVERFLGEGAFAEVYRVKHRFLGRQALKIFKRFGMSIDEIHEMLGEAILLSRLGHPNIVRVYDANVLDTARGQCGYFTMEHVPGGSLESFWRSHGNNLVPLEISLDLTKQVCRGLAVAHRERPPIVHRDVKPQNILVGYETEGLRARVSDFGLAKAVNPLTLLATSAGTVAFKPPEAFTDKQGDSCASDVWAIGSTLYMLLTDKLPFAPATAAAEGGKESRAYTWVPPSRINPNATKPLDQILEKALQTDPRSRYQTAQELLEALEGLRAEPVRSRRSTDRDSQTSKLALGAYMGGDDSEARALAAKALECKSAGALPEAADLMEEAFNKSPALRDTYAEQVKLWRRGISM